MCVTYDVPFAGDTKASNINITRTACMNKFCACVRSAPAIRMCTAAADAAATSHRTRRGVRQTRYVRAAACVLLVAFNVHKPYDIRSYDNSRSRCHNMLCNNLIRFTADTRRSQFILIVLIVWSASALAPVCSILIRLRIMCTHKNKRNKRHDFAPTAHTAVDSSSDI